MRRACSIRSASEKPRSLFTLARTSSALKWTALSRGASTFERVVLPAPGNPMIRIFRCMLLLVGWNARVAVTGIKFVGSSTWLAVRLPWNFDNPGMTIRCGRPSACDPTTRSLPLRDAGYHALSDHRQRRIHRLPSDATPAGRRPRGAWDRRHDAILRPGAQAPTP